MEKEIKKRLKIAKEIAIIAGDSLKNKRERILIEKKQNDFVTKNDLETEILIKDYIKKFFPNDNFFGEELGEEKNASRGRWIIDPIDGTVNFARNMPLFSISIAWELEDRKPLLGVIYCPVTDELFWGSENGGAWLNGESIHTSDIDNPKEAICVCVPPHRKHEKAKKYFSEMECIFNQCSDLRSFGSAALEMAYISSGRLDTYFEYALGYYDIAAGEIILKEAGGKIEPYPGTVFEDYNCNIICANGDFLLAWLKGVIN